MNPAQSPDAKHGNVSSARLARAITRRASTQTYQIIRWLVDRGRTEDAFRAYAYFRWVDDVVDAPAVDRGACLTFLARQKQLCQDLMNGARPASLNRHERMLADLMAGRDAHPGLPSYLERMMAVIEFDALRRGRLITLAELDRYTFLLATAVWDAIEYFVGHTHRYLPGPARVQAASGAHIIHMLRDTADDLPAGYFNIPSELLEAHGLRPGDTQHPAYVAWVRERVEQARRCFLEGKRYLRSTGCLRATITGYLYIARFEFVLRRIEADGYHLRASYPPVLALPAFLANLLRAHRLEMRGLRRTDAGGAG